MMSLQYPGFDAGARMWVTLEETKKNPDNGFNN